MSECVKSGVKCSSELLRVAQRLLSFRFLFIILHGIHWQPKSHGQPGKRGSDAQRRMAKTIAWGAAGDGVGGCARMWVGEPKKDENGVSGHFMQPGGMRECDTNGRDGRAARIA